MENQTQENETQQIPKKIRIIGIIIMLIFAGIMIFVNNVDRSNGSNQLERFSDFYTFLHQYQTNIHGEPVGLFDTFTNLVGYAQSQNQFDQFSEAILKEMTRLHMLFDIHSQFYGVNNLYIVNQNAGIAPVVVDDSIISLLNQSVQMYHYSGGMFNIALGPVLTIWRDYRNMNNENMDNPNFEPTIPSMEALVTANQLTNINDLIIDEANNTVFLRYPGMSLDVGAIAKGYAVDVVVEVASELGFDSFVISMGGDTFAQNPPPEGIGWNIGIENNHPNILLDRNFLDILSVYNTSVVTSGTYQRLFYVDGVAYHHIIDPTTLMPAHIYFSVTIQHDSGIIAEMLSTAVFMLEPDEALALLDRFGAGGLLITNDGSLFYNDYYRMVSRYFRKH